MLRRRTAGAGVRPVRQSDAPGAAPRRATSGRRASTASIIDGNDFVWLAGNGKKDGQLLKFTMDGKFVLQIGKQGEATTANSTERLGSPADIAVDVAAKEVYAADGYANRRVVVFDSETGAYKRHWGAYGKKPSDEKTPAYDPAKPASRSSAIPCIACASTRTGSSMSATAPMTACRFSARTARSSPSISTRRTTRGTGSVYELVFSPDKAQKFIYMIDGMNGEVRIVDHASKQTLGRFGRPGRQAGEFTALHNIAVDHQGNIYTAEVKTGQRVQRFRRLDIQN